MSDFNGAPPPTHNPSPHSPPMHNGHNGQPLPPYPQTPPGSGNRKTLAIVLGSIGVVVGLALLALFIWIIPALTKDPAASKPAPTAGAGESASATASQEASPQPRAEGTAAGTEPAEGMPAGAIPLPPGWDQLAGPGNVPQDGDPAFRKFVTGESSFQYLTGWDHDGTFGISTDPQTGKPMQQVAQGTPELDADGISTAFAFFAESEEGKFGSDPAKVKAAIADTQDKLGKMSVAELGKQLVGHKCASDFQSTKPETREFRRGLAVVVEFSCKTAAGSEVQSVNLFSVTPWGTPQMMGVSGHKDYWDANPGRFEQLANTYRINKWKM